MGAAGDDGAWFEQGEVRSVRVAHQGEDHLVVDRPDLLGHRLGVAEDCERERPASEGLDSTRQAHGVVKGARLGSDATLGRRPDEALAHRPRFAGDSEAGA